MGPNRHPLLNRHDDLYISSWLYLQKVVKYVIAYGRDVDHSDEEMVHATENALSSNDANRTPVTMMRHLREWWSFARELQDMGLLDPEDRISWNKSTVFLASAACVGTVAIAITVIVMIYRKTKKI